MKVDEQEVIKENKKMKMMMDLPHQMNMMNMKVWMLQVFVSMKKLQKSRFVYNN
jgi:hypothetical protein